VKRVLAFVVLLVTCWCGPAWAQQTVLWLQSDAGDYIGIGQTNIYASPAYGISAAQNYAQGLSFEVAGWRLDLASTTNTALLPGAYEGAARYAFRGNVPGARLLRAGSWMQHGGRSFRRPRGRDERVGGVQSFAADFEQHCEGDAPALWGEIRFNSTYLLTINKPAGTTMPGPMSFAAQILVPPSTLLTSNATTVYGINAPAAISITAEPTA
jgi:hypothetical protein